MTTIQPDARLRILAAAAGLIAEAGQAGLVVTIATTPKLPLAMGNYKMAISVRDKRGAAAPAAEVGQQVEITATASCSAWNALRDLTDPLGEEGAKIMGHVRTFAQRQYEAGREEGRSAPAAPAQQAAPAVAWRSRMGPADTWTPCSQEHYDMVLRAPIEWPGYEVQSLAVAAPQPAQETDRDWTEAQAWAGMDGTTAYWLIQRHADGWGDAGAMMEAWQAANSPAALTHAQRLDLATAAFTIAARTDPTCVLKDADEERVLALLGQLSGIPLTADEGAAHGQPT